MKNYMFSIFLTVRFNVIGVHNLPPEFHTYHSNIFIDCLSEFQTSKQKTNVILNVLVYIPIIDAVNIILVGTKLK